jgi:hypothetical protein
MTSDDIRDDFEHVPGGIDHVSWGKKRGLQTMTERSRMASKSHRTIEKRVDDRRNAPITLPKFKCLEEGK